VTTERSTPARAGAAGAPEILVIHPGALGDVLQAVPALAALRALDGGRRVTLAAQPRIARLLVGAGAVDAALAYDGLGLEALFAEGEIPRELRSRLAAFDRVVSWFGSRADPFPARLRACAPGAVVAPPVPDEPVRVWRHLLATVTPWDARPPDPLPILAVPAGWRDEADRALERAGARADRPVVVLHPGAGGADKRWPAAKMAAAVRRLAPRVEMIVHQGPADAEPAAALIAALAASSPCPTAAVLVEPPLETLAAVLARAAAYLGSDSGISHLAAAVGAPAVIVFAPGARARWTPWGPGARAVDSTAGDRDVDEAAAALTAILGATSGPAPGPEPVPLA